MTDGSNLRKPTKAEAKQMARDFPDIVKPREGARVQEGLELGPWICMTTTDEHQCFEFLEMHQSDRGDGIVFRVSEFFDVVSEIRLGKCAILNRKQATALRDRLNVLIERLPEK